MNAPILAWTKQFHSSSHDFSYAIAADRGGNIFLSGFTSGEVSEGQQKGSYDAFLARYNGRGDLVWVEQLGTAAKEEARGVAADRQGNVLVCGYTIGDLEPGKQPGSEDLFLAKFSAKGDLRWLRQIGDVAAEHAYGIATDQFGNVLICGSGTSSGDPAEAGGFHSFLGKYDTEGGEIWTRKLEGGASQVAYAVATDPLGNAFVSGTLTDTMGRSRGYLAKFDADGAPVWRETIAPALRCQGYGLTSDLYGNLYMSGFSTGELLAGPEDRGWDAWLAKFMDDVSVPHHHLLVENRFAHLGDQLDRIELMMDLSELDLGLLQSARANVKGRGESRISKAEAQELLDLAIDRETKTISLLRKKTLAFIYAKYNLTRGALTLIEGAIAGD